MPDDIFSSLNPDRSSPEIPQADALRFDLATPDTASDDELKAAARRISTGLFGVPDPDGRLWNRDHSPFATGADYFRRMKAIADSAAADAATPELRAFEQADDAGRIKLARAAMSTGDRAAESAGRTFGGASGIPSGPELAGAPDAVREAAGRMSATAGALRDMPEEQRRADMETLAAWRNQRADAELVSAHRAKLMADNAWLQFAAARPALSAAAQSVAEDIVRHRTLPATRIADFEALPEDERRALAQLSTLTRPHVPGGFWNTLGDAAIGAVNSAVQTPANALRQAARLADVSDPEDINRRARDEQILWEAAGRPLEIGAIADDHGYLARSFIGAVATLPYMGYASIPYAGPATIALDAMQRFEDRVAADGGDITGKDWLATKLLFGSMYAGIERLQALPILMDKGPLDLRLAFVSAFTQRGAGAAAKIAAHVGETTLGETVEDSAQQAMEEAAVALGLRRDAWEPAVRGAARDFIESAGAFGLVSAVGTARMARGARSLGGKPLADKATAALARERLSAMDAESAAPELAARQIGQYLQAWEQGGRTEQALEDSGVAKDRAALLHEVFTAGENEDRARREIESRNLTVRDARTPGEMDLDADAVAAIVQNFGADAASELRRRGFTEAGANLVADYARQADALRAKQNSLFAALRQESLDALNAKGETARASDAARDFSDLAPLREIWAKAQTRAGAVKAYAQSGFSVANAERLADAFEAEHALATSPQAAAAFRALYVEGSRVESARDLARRMLPGYDVEDAPDAGPSAFRMTGNTEATRPFSLLVETGTDAATMTDSEAYAASVEEATRGAVTAAQWMAMTPDERRAVSLTHGLRTLGDFTVVDEADPSVRADAAGGRVLTGRVRLTDAARAATQFHEIAHGWIAFMRRSGRLTDADIAQLRAKYGPARTTSELFNEEAFADDFREWLADKSNPPEKSHLARFHDAVRGLLSTAAASEAGRLAAADGREALFQSIAHGTEFGGVQNLAPISTAPQADIQTSKPNSADAATPPDAASPVSDLRPPPPAQEPPAQILRDGHGRPAWTASTPQGGVKVGGHWQVMPLADLITSDRSEYDQSLQQRTRGESAASAEQVASIVADFDPTRLFDAPETSNGAPIVTPANHVLSGNGRTAALRLLASEHRYDEYRNAMAEWAKTRGIEIPAGIQDPVLVRVVTRQPAGVPLQKIAALSNRESVLRMTDAEQAGADAELIEGAGTAGLYQANADGLPSRRGSEEFFRWFLSATGDASIMDSDGGITEAGRQRARRAMLALAIGRGKNGKDIVRAFVENAADLGLAEQADALDKSVGKLVALGQNKPPYGLSQELTQAAASLLDLAARRKTGKPVTAEEHLAQGDLLAQPSAAAQKLVRLLDSGRGAEEIAAALRRYADLADKIDLQTADMFGEPPAPKDALLKKAVSDTKPGTTRYSVESDDYRKEYDAVVAAHTNPDGTRKGSWLKAHNGKPTNLTERQWIQVRTPAFKAWFGDWEKAPEKSSKVVDENGEPKVVYHGSRSTSDFNTFNWGGTFFTDNRRIAEMFKTEAAYTLIVDGERYDLSEREARNIKDALEPYEDMGWATGRNLAEDEGSLNKFNDLVADGGLQSGVSSFDGANDVRLERSANDVFEVFLNVRNPREVDFHGETWGVSRPGLEMPEKTFAKLKKNEDGLIVKNIVEGGFAGEIDGEAPPAATDYIVGASTQIKSATDNTGSFDRKDPDIRYSVQSRRLEPFNLPDGLAEVSAGTSVSALSQTALREERARHKELRDIRDWDAAERYARGLTAEPRTRLLGQYLLAKYHGDVDAAKAVVDKWAKPEEALRVKMLIGDSGLLKPTLAAPVGQREGNRFNALPYVYAAWLARQVGGAVMPITKLSGAANTGAAMSDRVSRDYAFAGGERADGASPIVLVDDVWTTGQTLWSVYEHIKAVNPSARVVAFAALASGRYGKNVRPTRKQLTAFWEKSNLATVSFKERVGNGIEKLTGSEIQAYLLTGGRGADAAAAFFGGRDRGIDRPGGEGVRPVRGEAGPVRYSVDTRGERYSREALLSGFVAHSIMTKSPTPSKATIGRMAQQIGLQNWNYAGIVKAGKELAETSVNQAIRAAAGRGGTDNAAFAIGELAREAQARELVRSGAREGERLGRNLATIGRLTEDGVRTAIRATTGADYSEIERDTGFDIAASILAADPAKFAPQEEKTQPETAAATDAASASGEEQGPAVPENENDPDAPGLTDRQRYEILKRNREREDRARALIDAAMKRGDTLRGRDEERKARTAADNARGGGAETPTDAASGSSAPASPAEPESNAAPVNEFRDRWDFAAFLRVWAYEQWRKLNPGAARDEEGLAKNRVATEFYRKTVVNELTSLARRLIEPGFPRENIMRHIGEIQQGLSAATIERKSAFVFGMINAQAVRTEKAKLIDGLKRDIKQRFVKGKDFDELGTDVDRKLRGQIEEDARWIIKVCELSAESVREGSASPLDETRARLNQIISGRMGLTGPDGEPLPAGESDMELSRALRRLALLDSYGGMVDLMPGEILDLKADILKNLERETKDLEERWAENTKTIDETKTALAEGIALPPGTPKVKQSKIGEFVDSLIGMLRLRLDHLTRYAAPEKRARSREAIAKVMRIVNDGDTAYATTKNKIAAELRAALGAIFVDAQGRPDYAAQRKWLRRLDETIPHELAAQITRQGHEFDMTYGNMLNLLASIEQPSKADSVRTSGRVGQSALIRTWRGQDKDGKAVSAFTPQDEAFVEWLRRKFYPENRSRLSVVMEKIAGRGVDSPDPLYVPWRTYLDGKKQGMHRDTQRWEPIAKAFSRRVKNNLDVNEKASILDVFFDQAHETAKLVAWAERGIILRAIFTDTSLQQAVKGMYAEDRAGSEQLGTILEQLEQSLNGGRGGSRKEREMGVADMCMRVAAFTTLGYKVDSALKQAVSVPVFANAIGFKNLIPIMFTKGIDWSVVKKLRQSDEFSVRYGTAPGSGMDVASKALQEGYADATRTIYQKFLGEWAYAPMKGIDALMATWVGQGIYRDLYATNLDNGMTEKQAEKAAMTDTWATIEETQQSGRTHNLTSLTRNHGTIGKMLTMYATSTLQQMQYEVNSIREWADLKSNGGPEDSIREAGNRAMRAIFINHILVQGLMVGINALYKSTTGGEPDWKKDGFWWTLFIECLMGQFSRIFFMGALTKETMSALFMREPFRAGQLIPAENVIKIGTNLAWGVHDVVTWNSKKFDDDIKRILRSSAATRLPYDVYENYFGKPASTE